MARSTHGSLALCRWSLETDPDAPERDEEQEKRWCEMMARLLWELGEGKLFYVNPNGLQEELCAERVATRKEKTNFLRQREKAIVWIDGPTPLSQLLEWHTDYEFQDACAVLPEIGSDWVEELHRLTPNGVFEAEVFSRASWVIAFGSEEMRLDLVSTNAENSPIPLLAGLCSEFGFRLYP